MKKLLFLLLCVLLIFSCGEQTAKDINITEINDACEWVDAYLIVMDEMIDIYDNADIRGYAEKSDQEKIDKLKNIIQELEDYFAINYREDVLMNCPNFQELKKKYVEELISPTSISPGISRELPIIKE